MSDDHSDLLPGPAPTRQAENAADAALDVLILSRDRACQLDAVLRSARAFLSLPHRVHVLYTTSNLAFERGYNALRRWYPEVDWVEEGGPFRMALLELLERIAAGPGRHLMPMVDDQIFTRPFSAHGLVDLLDEDEDVLAVSLRLGENITYCHPRKIKTTPPDFSNGHRWDWKRANAGYWNYPMSVDANIYRTADIAPYWPTLPFQKAEVLEAAMSRRPLERPHLVCEAAPSVLNLAMHRVQSTFQNPAGNLRPEALNTSFLSGFAMDVRPLIGRTFNSCHVEAEVSLILDARWQPAGPRPPASPAWKPTQ